MSASNRVALVKVVGVLLFLGRTLFIFIRSFTEFRHNASMRNLNQPDMEISCHLFSLTVKDQEIIILFYERISSYKSEQSLTK